MNIVIFSYWYYFIFRKVFSIVRLVYKYKFVYFNYKIMDRNILVVLRFFLVIEFCNRVICWIRLFIKVFGVCVGLKFILRRYIRLS